MSESLEVAHQPRAQQPRAQQPLAQRISHQLQQNWKSLVLLIPFLWLLIFFLAPFFIVFKISLSEATIASPPYMPMVEWAEGRIMRVKVVFDNYAYLWEDDLYNIWVSEGRMKDYKGGDPSNYWNYEDYLKIVTVYDYDLNPIVIFITGTYGDYI